MFFALFQKILHFRPNIYLIIRIFNFKLVMTYYSFKYSLTLRQLSFIQKNIFLIFLSLENKGLLIISLSDKIKIKITFYRNI
jgi:hypothetical protein